MKWLDESLQRVIQTRSFDRFAGLQYGIPIGQPEKWRFEKRFLSPINTPVFDGQGKLTHIIHQMVDITSRVAAETANCASEHRFKALTDATGEVVYRLSPDWRRRDERNGRVLRQKRGPIPRPPAACLDVRSAFTNILKQRANSSGRIPIPLSKTTAHTVRSSCSRFTEFAAAPPCTLLN